MADRYSLRSTSQQDESPNPYATLPSFGALAPFVSNNMTELKSSATGREVEGCHPSRWIYELLNNKFTRCDMFDRARHAQIDFPLEWQHQHRLVVNGNQGYTIPSTRLVSAVCLDCHFHFVLNISWDEHKVHDCCNQVGNARWPLQEDMFPWHHLVWSGSEPDPILVQYRSKYNPLLAREKFFCTAPPCTFQITLDVSEPRMGSNWMRLLLDREAILKEIRIAKEKEPERYEHATEAWADEAPLNLNTYLKNLLESEPDQLRNISKRNKRFAVLFGLRCAEIFRGLEFTEEIAFNGGFDEGLFTPKAPGPPTGPNGSTELATFRAYIEDVRQEVECLIYKAGQTLQAKPVFLGSGLHQHLGCKEMPNISSNAFVNLDRYKLMGVLPGQSRQIIVNAYFRQWALLPSKRRFLIESLVGIANDSGDAQLSEFAMTQSSVFESQVQIQTISDDDGLTNQALIFLGLSPPNTHSVQAIIDAFRVKIIQSPADGVTAKSMLMVIAQASTNLEYQSVLLMEATGLSPETSRAVLGLTGQERSWRDCLEVAKEKIESSKLKDEKLLCLNALDSIADSADWPELKAASAELRVAHIDTRGDQAETSPANMALPVGLQNIGNTCYLNSLLQYLFTVKAVRNIVLNYDDYQLELNDEVIKERRLGGNMMQMDRGEAVVARAFVRELAILFRNLQTSNYRATRPSQRLANAVLLSTHSLLEDAKMQGTTGAPNPPPVPARPPPRRPDTPPNEEDTAMTGALVHGSDSMLSGEEEDTIMASSTMIEGSETCASDGSSQTLVDLRDPMVEADGDSERSSLESKNPYFGKGQLQEVNQDVRERSSSESAAHHSNTSEQVSGLPSSPPSLTDTVSVSDVDILTNNLTMPPTIDEKVLGALQHQTRSSGTDQQDVEEVIGSIINRLQAAIRPSCIDGSTGIQFEQIMETFFVTTVNYTKKFDEKTYQHENSFDRSITAFPASDGICSLYDALGRNFDQQVIEEDKLSRYTAIKKLPPILHVLIQRSQSVLEKNSNPVVIPDTLYLDRYMDAPHGSPEFKRRVAQWARGDRLVDVKNFKSQSDKCPLTGATLQSRDFIMNGKGDGGDLSDSGYQPNNDVLAMDGPIDGSLFNELMEDMMAESPPALPEIERIPTISPDLADDIESLTRRVAEEELAMQEDKLKVELENLKQFPYRLQAVICHRGHLRSGHYWVWIHDFEDNVWRSYNDSDVQENRNTQEVLDKLSSSGEPYYLCYVRDGDKENYVNVPKRQLQTNTAIGAQESSQADVIMKVQEIHSDNEEETLPLLERSPSSPQTAEIHVDNQDFDGNYVVDVKEMPSM